MLFRIFLYISAIRTILFFQEIAVQWKPCQGIVVFSHSIMIRNGINHVQQYTKIDYGLHTTVNYDKDREWGFCDMD
jgi:hypothetical protein